MQNEETNKNVYQDIPLYLVTPPVDINVVVENAVRLYEQLGIVMLPTDYDKQNRVPITNEDIENVVLKLNTNNEEPKRNMFNDISVWNMPILQRFCEIKRKREKIANTFRIKNNVKALKHRNKCYLSDYIDFGFGRAL